MAKQHERAIPEAVPFEEPPPAKAPALGEPRVVPEFRPADPGSGMSVFATRLADFPAEKAAGWKRFKASARQPAETTWPNAYVLAPDAKAAEEAYRKHFGVVPEGKVVVKEMPD